MNIAEKLMFIAENERKIYNKGSSDKDSQFWDSIQDYGNRTDYIYAFARWGGEYIRPKYKVSPSTTVHHMFFACRSLKRVESEYFDFSKVPLNYSASTQGVSTMFNGCSNLEQIDDVGLIGGYYYQTFANCMKLHTIKKITVDENTKFTDAFTRCDALANITIEGVIGQTIEFKHSPLSIDSLKNIILCLKDYDGTTNENKYTLTITSDCNTRLLNEGNTAPGGVNWINYALGKKWGLITV